MIGDLVEIALHADKYIPILIQNYGNWVYLILFLIVFCETGLVFVPFLPGDSLLFAAGAIAALGSADIKVVFIIFIFAAVIGNTVNYAIGYTLGTKISERFLKKEYLERAQSFFNRYGAAAIIVTRFMPIIRTFTPFTAGIGKMKFIKFMIYNAIGGLLWVVLLVSAGYKFGSVPFVKNHFTAVTYTIIIVSLLPAIISFFKRKTNGQQ